MTSMKAELFAIIFALIVCQEDAYVMIYTDSKSFIEKYTSLLKETNRFCYSRSNLKDTYTKYCQILFHIIETLNLKLTLKKVKAHRNNKHNNDADYLAKEAIDLPTCMDLNTASGNFLGINLRKFTPLL